MWFQELLPKADERPSSNDRASIVNRAIEAELNYLSSAKNIWTPSFCNAASRRGQNYWASVSLSTRDVYAPSTPVYYRDFARKTAELDRYFASFLPPITVQVSADDVAPSVFEYDLQSFSDQQERENEWNTRGLESGLNPMQFLAKKKKDIRASMAQHMRDAVASKLQVEDFGRRRGHMTVDSKFAREIKLKDIDAALGSSETEEELELKRVAEREAALADLKTAEEELKSVENRIQQYINEMRQLQALLRTEEEKYQELQKKHQQLKIVFDRLPDAKANIEKLKQLAEDQASKLAEYAEEWEKHRLPLVEEYRSIRDRMFVKETAAKAKLDLIKGMRARIREMVEEVHKKDESYKQLLDLYKTLPKDARGNYTKRILEMVKNVKKQIVEINKVLVDTKALQKEINSVTETLNRSFAVTEELVFADAKKHPEIATVYKKLASMNDAFNGLVDTSEKTASTRNDILSLEEKITKVQTRTANLNLDTMLSDLAAVRSENVKFEERIKRFTAKLQQIQQGEAVVTSDFVAETSSSSSLSTTEVSSEDSPL
jgi:DNA repair exonuclease SbcCD ATPase subunit